MSNYPILFSPENARHIRPQRVQNTIRLGDRHSVLKVGDALDLRVTPPADGTGGEGELIAGAVCAGCFLTTVGKAIEGHAPWNHVGLDLPEADARIAVRESLESVYPGLHDDAVATVVVFVPMFNTGD